MIQRRAGRKLLVLARVKVPRNGRVTKLIPLDTNSNRGPRGVGSSSSIRVRIALSKTKSAPALVSLFRAVGV